MPIKFAEPPVQAALIVAITTLVTVILGLIFKDYLIPGWVESRSRKRRGQALLDQYRIKLFKACEALASRLAEIYRIRSHYLWADAPKREFYLYKYQSSVYRLCVLLGWIRAYRMHEALLSFKKIKSKYAVSHSMEEMASALADGQTVEMYVAKAICSILNIDLAHLSQDALFKFSVQVDELVQKYVTNRSVNFIADLPSGEQEDFIRDVVALIPSFSGSLLTKTQCEAIIKEVSVKLGLIYRDWQQAIGDLMVERNDGSDLSHGVIGYRQFENIMSMPESNEERKWVAKAERVFQGLDLRAEHRMDSRIHQLKRLYGHAYKLMVVLNDLDEKSKPVKPDRLRNIPSSI